ncbi:putative N-acetyltransferase, MSMEG_0567 N-terminal domain family [Quadrisphaera granulorum]|uniref:Putative N-acetyltransferase (TIGR04045 family) n=1 Tax=Quadrisphaera granulorum TaxID=317664 RepID=A0A316A7N5_9ACTN|nr:MSMEG_0567/sll0787 family protein [Quadrisphaera granulorum]PWJ53459.1 putative N-acetyltransferase (TIGR04045 family) [Quadrisphaera granulorum]SZE96801.1 putative N-acetyltransferase, MSMEG_0567 N-terminal domain family [Quadrisphaera granulorum]
MSGHDLGSVLLGALPSPARPAATWRIEVADAAGVAVHRRLRREVFVAEQGLFGGGTAEDDDVDDDPRTVVLVAREETSGGWPGRVLGGVRLAPAGQHLTGGVDVGWWAGSRLAVDRGARASRIGPALVRAACAHAEAAGALRFDATVQAAGEAMFARLGWLRVRDVVVPGAEGVPHVLMRWPIGRTAALLEATKAPLGGLLAGLLPADAHLGDDAAPVPGGDLVAACDAVVPSMVERDPEWAGWCAALVNVNDVAAMGATPVGLLDAVGARDASFAARVLSGLRAACEAYGVPLLGGHTQLGVPAALSATALGRVPAGLAPVPGGGGRPGHAVWLAVDTAGGWRRGYSGRQWDSTTSRTPAELRALTGVVARTRPAAAKDVSMAGVVGTLAMLAEASGTGAVLDVAEVPRPPGATAGDWLTCFPGTGFLLTDDPSRDLTAAAPELLDVDGFRLERCGELTDGASGVLLRWPDGETTPGTAPDGRATGLGPAHPVPEAHDHGNTPAVIMDTRPPRTLPTWR